MRDDGPTEIHLGQAGEFAPIDQLVFDGQIDTPNKKLSIITSMNEEILAADVAGLNTHVRVFANDGDEPDRISILFDL
jgi:hypothetical protein